MLSDQRISAEMYNAIFTRLSTINEKDIKEYDQTAKKRIIAQLIALRKLAQIDDVQPIHMLELDISLKLLKSKVLEKRLKGLTEIKEMLNDSINNHYSSFWGSKSQELETDQILTWILDRKVLSILTSNHSHAELLKRSFDLFEHMIKKRKLSMTHIQNLWASMAGRHESYVRSVFEVISRMASALSNSDTKQVLDLVTRNYPELDEKYLTFLKNFSLLAMKNDYKQRNSVDLYATETLFKWATLKHNEIALRCVIDLLKECPSESIQEAYLSRAISNFINEQSVPQSLTLFFALIETKPICDQEEFMRKILKSNKLLPNAVTSINNYVEITRQRLITEDTLTSDNTLHSENLRIRFRLLSFLAKMKMKFEISSVEVLWTYTVVNPILESDSAILFTWLMERLNNKELDANKVLALFANPKMFNFKKATFESFEAFHRLFLSANKAELAIEARGITILKRKKEQLQSFDTMLNFALKAENERVNKAAFAVIVECMVFLDVSVDTMRVWETFTKGLLSAMQEKDKKKVMRTLKLCHELVDLRVEVPPFHSNAARIQLRVSLPDNRSEKMAIPSDAPLSFFRKKIAAMLNTHPTKVELVTNSVLDFAEDEQPCSRHLAHSYYVNVKICHSVIDYVRPTEFLSGDMTFELLFQLAEDASYSSLVWNLIRKLPTSRTIRMNLELMKRQALEQKSFHKLLYSLIVIIDLCQDTAYANKFCISREGRQMIKRVFEMNLVTVECSGLLTVEFVEVVCLLVTMMVSRGVDVIGIREILHYSVNFLFSLSEKLTKGSEKAIQDVINLLENSFSDENQMLYAACFATHRKIKGFFLSTLISSEIVEVRLAVSKMIIKFGSPPYSLCEIFLQQLLDMLTTALRAPNALYYFSTVSKLVEVCGALLGEKLTAVCLTLFHELPLKTEKSPHDPDESLIGPLSLIRAILAVLRLTPNQETIEFILKRCLFDVPAICKHPATRRAAFKLLAEMLFLCTDYLQTAVAPYLSGLFLDPSRRTGRLIDWEVRVQPGEKSSHGYIGIRNTGSICYMISVVQQLFMIPSFCSQIMNLRIEPSPESALAMCQRVFFNLKFSQKQSVGIGKLCRAMAGCVDAEEQMDVEEFLNAFMARMEQELGSSKDLILNHFAGQAATEIAARCGHTGEKIEMFLTLPLEVKNKKNLYESLESLVLGETLEGDNAYQCDLCSSRVPAQRRLGIRHLPNVLLFALRRFDYNLDTMQRRKLNDYYEFPWELDLEPYTIEGLHRKDAHDLQRMFADDYYMYKLRGVVIHTGSAEGGHYYCFIQARESGKWFEFNDRVIKEVDREDILAEAFGGEEQFRFDFEYENAKGEMQEKVSNAYMLLYEREGKYAARTGHEVSVTPLEMATEMTETESSQGVIHEVIAKNQKNWSRNNTFSHEFVNFMLEIAKKMGHFSPAFQLSASYFLTVVCRSEDQYDLPQFFSALQTALSSNLDNCSWFLETISGPEVVRELLISCPHTEIRRIIILLANIASKAVSAEQKANSLGRVLSILGIVRKSNHFSSYFDLVYLLAAEEGHYVAGVLIDFVMDRVAEVSETTPTTLQGNSALGYADFSVSKDHFRSAIGKPSQSIGSLLATLGEIGLSVEQQAEVLSPSFIQNSIALLEGKRAARQAARLYFSVTTTDVESSKALLDTLLVIFEGQTKEKKKLILRIFSHLLSCEDSVSASRAHQILTSLCRLMKASKDSRDRSTIETLGEFIYKQCLKNEHACLWVSSSSAAFSWLNEWINLWAYKRSFYEKLDVSVSSKLRALAVGIVQREKQEWDSDEEVDFSAAKRVRMRRGERWEYLVIKENLQEVAKTQEDLVDGRVVWVECDAEDIMPWD